jgi:hypothetical protein
VRELFSLLGLKASADGSDLVVPVVPSVGRSPDEIRIDTRSLTELLQIAEAAVDVPEEDVRSGLAKDYPPLGALGKDLRIRCSEGVPENAMFAVEHEDRWYFIEKADLPTKRYFRLVQVLLSVLMSETSSQRVPVLTLPVSR